MPIITIDAPPIDVEHKRALACEITDAMEKAYGMPRSSFIIIMHDTKRENVGVGGELLCDR